MRPALLLVLAALPLAACGGSRHASGPPPPKLATVCAPLPAGVRAEPLWLETSDHVRLYAAEAGDGDTAVVVTHESPGGLCGSLPAVALLAAHGYRALAIDFRGFAPSDLPAGTKWLRLVPDLQAAVDAAHDAGSKRVFVLGASFGGAAALADAPRVHGAAGVVSFSGELEIAGHDLNALAGARRLHVPLLVFAARDDTYLDAADARRLVRAAAAPDKELALYPGSWHGWDLLEAAPYRARVTARLLSWLRARS